MPPCNSPAPLSAETIATLASIIAGFSITALMFRLQRELSIADENGRNRDRQPRMTWIPLADLMLIAAILLALVGGLVPSLLGMKKAHAVLIAWSPALSLASVALLVGYVPAILAHYKWIFWLDTESVGTSFWKDYTNPWEFGLVLGTIAGAVFLVCIYLAP